MTERMVGDDSMWFQGYYAAVSDLEKVLHTFGKDVTNVSVQWIEEQIEKLKSGKK